MPEEPRYTTFEIPEVPTSYPADLAADVTAMKERFAERYARGGVVHGPGEGVPIRIDLTREQIVTAEQASTRYRDFLQAVNDATPSRPSYCYYCHQPIHIMINRGTGWCSENCRKALADG